MTNPGNAESVAQYWISDNLEIPDTQYPIYLKTIRYEPDTDTDTDIITAQVAIPHGPKGWFRAKNGNLNGIIRTVRLENRHRLC